MLFVCDPGFVLPSALVKLWCTDASVWKDGKILSHLSIDTVVNAILRYTQERLFFLHKCNVRTFYTVLNFLAT